MIPSGINDVSGVCIGGVLGHFICTGLAVICGALIAKKVSVRVVTLVGALVFIGFAVASLFIDPYEENHLVPDVDVSNQFPRTYFEMIIPRVTTTTLQYSKRTKSSLSALPRLSFHSSHCGWRTNIKKSASQRYEILARIKASKKGWPKYKSASQNSFLFAQSCHS